MDTTAKNEQIEKETLGLVLEEFTQEQKLANQSINDLISAVNAIGSKVDDLKKEQEKPQAPVINDNKPLQQIVLKELVNIRQLIGEQPKGIVRKFQVLLFPEQDAKLFYKIVFSRWLLWLAVMLLITNIYKFSISYNDNQKEIKIEQIENDRIRKSWNYMYNHNGKAVKLLMEKAYARSGQQADQ
ncbi:hypothetical protein J7E50_12715 [Pedobacter sp. ISL-68]|uniref:hypothetical protein n=1 Tax=unclassified Pedobacter TaxID=2628915 RepID=UPI001BEB945D|nr:MULTISPECIES: hypothetical protein [unclassified Pedobacter]MBT2561699.1 hypothetical protein [Pedobacter sp. ISL-64]MBT2591087.1 hypothetical protein [Pedobacter sp. ISL-68]